MDTLSALGSLILAASGCWIWLDKKRRSVESETFADKYALWVLARDSRADALRIADAQLKHHEQSITAERSGHDGLIAAYLLKNAQREREALYGGQKWEQRVLEWSYQFYASRWYAYAVSFIFVGGILLERRTDEFSLSWTYATLAALTAGIVPLLIGSQRAELNYRRWITLWSEVGIMIDDKIILDIVRYVEPDSAANFDDADLQSFIGRVHSRDKSLGEITGSPDPNEEAQHFPLHQYAQDVVTVASTVFACYEVTGKAADFADFLINNDRKLAVVERTIRNLRELGLNAPANVVETVLDKVLDFETKPKERRP
jgi:hypothetical protein